MAFLADFSLGLIPPKNDATKQDILTSEKSSSPARRPIGYATSDTTAICPAAKEKVELLNSRLHSFGQLYSQ